MGRKKMQVLVFKNLMVLNPSPRPPLEGEG
jgi:hypothetical protein